MNISDMLSKMTPQMLQQGISKMSGMLSQEDMKKIGDAIKSAEKGELDNQLNHMDANMLRQELSKNPNLAKQLTQNPEIMKKIDEIFKKQPQK